MIKTPGAESLAQGVTNNAIATVVVTTCINNQQLPQHPSSKGGYCEWTLIDNTVESIFASSLAIIAMFLSASSSNSASDAANVSASSASS
jgi:hypothetical protein